MDYYDIIDMVHFAWRQNAFDRYGLQQNWVNKIFDMKWYHRMPPITKVWFTISFVIPLAAAMGFLNPRDLMLLPGHEYELWRPITALFYTYTGWHFVIMLYVLYKYASRIEREEFSDKPADMKFMVVLLFTMSIAVGMYLKVSVLYDFPIMAVLSVWCQLNKDRILPFEFGIRLKAQYLPWAICLSRYILGGNGKFEVIGVLVGYIYFYLKFGEKILNTPQFFKWFVTPFSQGRPGGVSDYDVYKGRGARLGADADLNPNSVRPEGVRKRVGEEVDQKTNPFATLDQKTKDHIKNASHSEHFPQEKQVEAGDQKSKPEGFSDDDHSPGNERLLTPSEKVRAVYLEKAARSNLLRGERKRKSIRPTGVRDAPRFSGSGSRLGDEVNQKVKPEITKEVSDGKLFSGDGLLLTPNEQIKAVYLTNAGRRNRLENKTKSIRPEGARDNTPFTGMSKSAWN